MEEPVANLISQKLYRLTEFSSNHHIRKVPEFIAKVKRECYEPSNVSIGPLHYNNRTLERFREMKLRIVQHFNGRGNWTLDQHVAIIRAHEDKIRNYYAEAIALGSDEFVEMITIDSAFIIFLFVGNCVPHFAGDVTSKERLKLIHQVLQDLFLEENQLPFFILQDLYNRLFKGVAHYPDNFNEVTFEIIKLSNLPLSEGVAKRDFYRIIGDRQIKHLLEFLRILSSTAICKIQNPLDAQSKRNFDISPTVKVLRAAGVKFIASNRKNFLDIEFSNGVLHIPTLTIYDETEAILRNIMFDEQFCCGVLKTYMRDYMCFLNDLIDTPEDVEILIQCGIIKNCLGNDEMAAILFNQITKYVNRGYCYASISKELKAHVSGRWNNWKATLRRDYFNHPWAIISFIYLVVLLILTALQVYVGFLH